MLFNSPLIMVRSKATQQKRFNFIIPGVLYLVLLYASSCKITRETSYFETLRKDTTLTGFIQNDFESKIQAGDQLSIIATSLSSVEDEQFNKAASASGSATTGGFNVLKDGSVLLHRLGHFQAAGFTRKELSTKLQQALLPFMKEPIVNVNYLNHKVTIMGAVGGPQVLPMPEEQLSIIDVLVKSGDITQNGLKNRVMIIREADNRKIIKYVNLQDASIFKSPWYYVQPNDIVVVRGDTDKVEKEERRQKFLTNFSLVTSVFSFVVVLYTLITR